MRKENDKRSSNISFIDLRKQHGFSIFFNDKRPILIMMVGIPGSGKSMLANNISVNRLIDGCYRSVSYPNIRSSDYLRYELYGDESDNSHNAELFAELHNRIKDDLKNGHDVVFDATNINKKKRMVFLDELKRIDCYKACIAVMTPYEKCLQFNNSRERHVTEYAIKKMYMSWQPPHYNEGFDDIIYYYNDDDKRSPTEKLFDLFCGENGLDKISQDNEHHQYTIGTHCKKVYKEIYKTDGAVVRIAGLLHDIGKGFTKTDKNSKGINDGNCHYYGHESVGAYMSLLILAGYNAGYNDFTVEEKTDIANIIFYHMRPLTSWKLSKKSMDRDRKLLGEYLYEAIMKVNEADLLCH